MRYLIFISLLLSSCTNTNKQIVIDQSKLINSKLIISNDALESDTLVFLNSNEIQYIHTGIGVNFSGEFYVDNQTIEIKILDFENQFKEDAKKKVVMKFAIIKEVAEFKLYKITKKNSLFDKIKMTSKIKVES